MSLRRSSRLTKMGDNQQEMADLAHQVISSQPRRGSKRKIEMPDTNLSTKGAPKTVKTKHAAIKTKKPCIQSSNTLKLDRLSNLPPEILSMVVNNVRIHLDVLIYINNNQDQRKVHFEQTQQNMQEVLLAGRTPPLQTHFRCCHVPRTYWKAYPYP